MSHSSKGLFLEEILALLVQQFGGEQVRLALSHVSVRNDAGRQKPRKASSAIRQLGHPTIVSSLELIRKSEPEKYHLLGEFLTYLKNRTVLPESQDIRHFAQLIGLKNIKGKSRKDMIPPLMRFLLEQPIEQLRTDLQSADKISEHQRQQGFSILTDKLLGKNDADSNERSTGRLN